MLELFVAGAFLVAASAIAVLDAAPARAVFYSLARRRRRRRQAEHDALRPDWRPSARRQSLRGAD
jgi:hypothetical protein